MDQVRKAAADVEATGIRVITIGLGGQIDRALLQEIASSPADYHEAPGTEDLARIYAEITRSLCPEAPMFDLPSVLFLPVNLS